MAYPAISFSTATAGRHRCPQKRLQTARQPPVYPNSSPDHRACNSLTPFPCPRAVHRWIRVKEPGELNADFEDVRTVLGYPGGMLMAVGRGRGRSGLVEAAQEAIAYPLLNLSMAGARGVIFSIKGGQDLTPAAVDAASAFISKACKHSPRTLFGMSIDHGLEDGVQLTLIATGL